MIGRCVQLRFILACWLVVLAAVQSAPVVAEDEVLRRKVLILGIDGCRTDALLAAETPNIDDLKKNGIWSDQVHILASQDSSADTVSGPGWSNLLTGVWPQKHGVTNNKFKGRKLDDYPHFFRRLKESRPQAVTVSLESWGAIHGLIVRDADVSQWLRKEKESYSDGDRKVTLRACRLLADSDPDAMFVYLGNVDATGHEEGFHPSVKSYMAAIETVDRQIGEILRALRARSHYRLEDWLILVCTDHGGEGKEHGDGHKNPNITTVFMIVSGPSAERGKLDRVAYQVDVAATALAHLGVPIRKEWKLDGKPVGLKE